VGLVELVDLIRRPEEVVMGDFSSISRVGKGTGDSSGSELGLGCSAQPHRRTQSLLAATALLTSALSLSPVVVGLTILCLHYHLLLLCLNITPAMTRVFTIYIINKISEFSTVYMW